MAESRGGVLAGLRVVEMEAMGPVPLAGKMLADMGADVVRIARHGAREGMSEGLLANRPALRLDLNQAGRRQQALQLIAESDAVIEGFRPGVMEKLGLGPEICLAANPALVFVRVTGWGQTGPRANCTGHDLNYIAMTGVLHAIGAPGSPPPPPLNLVGDYGGGTMFALVGLLAALLRARGTGQGQVVDAAMVDGVAALSSVFHVLRANGAWRDARSGNSLDGGAPFYRCYICADGGFVSVAALEPKYFAALLAGLGIAADRFVQRDRSDWSAMEKAFSAAFAAQPRAHWEQHFAQSDACVVPVLSFAEARSHPDNAARSLFAGPLPAPAPRFGATPSQVVPLPGDVVGTGWAWPDRS